MEAMKKTVRVTIEKEIEIELTPAVFGGMTVEEYLAEFNRSLWPIESIDDVFKYAAEIAATGGDGYEHDGLGIVDTWHSTHPRPPDVKFNVLYEDRELEIVSPT